MSLLFIIDKSVSRIGVIGSLHSHGIQASIQVNTHTPKINLNLF